MNPHDFHYHREHDGKHYHSHYKRMHRPHKHGHHHMGGHHMHRPPMGWHHHRHMPPFAPFLVIITAIFLLKVLGPLAIVLGVGAFFWMKRGGHMPMSAPWMRGCDNDNGHEPRNDAEKPKRSTFRTADGIDLEIVDDARSV
jgi:hypothetical protein